MAKRIVSNSPSNQKTDKNAKDSSEYSRRLTVILEHALPIQREALLGYIDDLYTFASKARR